VCNTTRRRWRPESARRRVRVLPPPSLVLRSLRRACQAQTTFIFIPVHPLRTPLHRHPTAPPAVQTTAVAVTRPSRITHTLIYIIYCVYIYIYNNICVPTSRRRRPGATAKRPPPGIRTRESATYTHTHTHTVNTPLPPPPSSRSQSRTRSRINRRRSSCRSVVVAVAVPFLLLLFF